MEKYRDLKREIQKIWNMRSVIVVSWIVGTFNSITKKLDEYLEQLDITLITALLKKISLFGTAGILRKIPKYYREMTASDSWSWFLTPLH